MGSGQSSVVQEEEFFEQRERHSNKKERKNKKRKNEDNNTLSNQYGGTLPGEDEDAYNGFFDELDQTFHEPVDTKTDDVEKISMAEDELKQIMEQVDKDIDVNEDDPIIKPLPPKDSAPDDDVNREDVKKTRLTDDVKPNKGKTKSKKDSTADVKSSASDWTYKQKIKIEPKCVSANSKKADDTIEGFDLEKFQKANVKIKTITNKETKNYEYKVYSVDPYDIVAPHPSSIMDIPSTRYGEKNKVPKYDFVDERLMSQIESEYS